ncbi:MAG TPA: thioredoxin [Bacteroidales bacterium]|nr:thioredoxin [Bacteroidales bacterium]
MKKNLLILLMLVAFLNGFAQELNTVVFDEKSNQEILIGFCNIEGFTSGSFNNWFQTEYDNYIIDSETLGQINAEMFDSLEITIVLGTWCSDSQREFPRFYKILEYLNFSFDYLTIIAVNREKKAEDTHADRLNIELVPTIIFYNQEKEIGRIIESPEISLEKDMQKILSKL